MTDPHHARHQPEFNEADEPHPQRQGLLLQMLDATDQDGCRLWKVLTLYRYQIGPTFVVRVPEGYITSFPTVPRIFRTTVELREVALIHDFLCNEDSGLYPDESGFSRWMADAVLWDVMTDLQINWFKRILVYATVRMIGIVTGQK